MSLSPDLLDRLRDRMADPDRRVDHRPGYVDPAAPLPTPPGGDALFSAEATMQVELPEEVRDLYAIADGGFGPGLGLKSLKLLVGSYEDLVRRGPDYTGELQWPRSYLPLYDAVLLRGGRGVDEARTLSIDTGSGAIMTFNEDWYDDDISADEAWTETAPSLEALLERWLGASPEH